MRNVAAHTTAPELSIVPHARASRESLEGIAIALLGFVAGFLLVGLPYAWGWL